jgi:hypothetical protein
MCGVRCRCMPAVWLAWGQAAAGPLDDSEMLLIHLSKAVGIEDVTYRDVKAQLVGNKLWPGPVFTALKDYLSAYLRARSRVIFKAVGSSVPGVSGGQSGGDNHTALHGALHDDHGSLARVLQVMDGSQPGSSGGMKRAAGGSICGSSDSNGRIGDGVVNEDNPAAGEPPRERMKGRLILRIVQASQLPGAVSASTSLSSSSSSSPSAPILYEPYCIVSLEIPAPPAPAAAATATDGDGNDSNNSSGSTLLSGGRDRFGSDASDASSGLSSPGRAAKARLDACVHACERAWVRDVRGVRGVRVGVCVAIALSFYRAVALPFSLAPVRASPG